MISKILFVVFSLSLAVLTCAAAASPAYVPSTVTPPAPQREFRGAWVATVANIDWPSKPGLPVDQQKAELIAILERASKLNLNAVVFQVRPACDAMYASKIEPWSYYLTGAMGQAPKPYYDPLAFVVAEAHKRGLELHAWFNPYRAGHPSNKSPISANHISKTHPNLVRQYGEYLWLDPGEKEVQDYSLRVVMDVVNRYDIDGVHLDDYFYPYKVNDPQKKEIDFPDQASWKKYGINSKLSRDDWRRENVNSFVQRLYQSIKTAKPWVKLGISPFGIWQPGNPPQIKGYNAYEKLYCDSRKWLVNGWMDYCAPQLYWGIQPPEQSYPVLLKWWAEQNPKHRNLWPGIDSGKVGGKWKPEEIINQVRLTRNQSVAPGNIHWSMKCLMENRGGLATEVGKELYAAPALVPPSPWLGTNSPSQPKLAVHSGNKLKWEPSGTDKVSWWVLQTKSAGQWNTSIFPGAARTEKFTGSPDTIAVTAIDRCGVASPPTVLQRAESSN
ncbi:MAG: hypothetical protein JWR69_1458 [Pedosphaera sp.]|nr:hypothetical protein [Pedosphaera sp.]